MADSGTPLRREKGAGGVFPLYKQNSWSPDILRDEAWENRRINQRRRRRGHSVTDDDLDELRGCLDLGFQFHLNSSDLDPKLSSTFPALPIYCAVNKQCSNSLSRSASASFSDCESAPSFAGSPSSSIIDPGEEPEMVKARLRQWAQIVACSVRQFSSN